MAGWGVGVGRGVGVAVGVKVRVGVELGAGVAVDPRNMGRAAEQAEMHRPSNIHRTIFFSFI